LLGNHRQLRLRNNGECYFYFQVVIFFYCKTYVLEIKTISLYLSKLLMYSKCIQIMNRLLIFKKGDNPDKTGAWHTKLKRLFVLALFFSFFSFAQSNAQIVINEFSSNGTVEVKNLGTSSVDISNYWLCNFPAYTQFVNLTLECGNLNLGPGELTTVSGFNVNNTDGELGLDTKDPQ